MIEHCSHSPRIALAAVTVIALVAGCGDSTKPREGTSTSGAAVELGTTNRPRTIPALREWGAMPGEFVLGSSPRVIVGSSDSSLLGPTASQFADELGAAIGATVSVASGDAPEAGDFLLRADDSDPGLGDEGYRLDIGSAITVTAPTDTGVFYGTRTLLQLLRQSRTISAGIARDWPRYPERGMMVDAGRKYFTPGWFEDRIRELAYLKLWDPLESTCRHASLSIL